MTVLQLLVAELSHRESSTPCAIFVARALFPRTWSSLQNSWTSNYLYELASRVHSHLVTTLTTLGYSPRAMNAARRPDPLEADGSGSQREQIIAAASEVFRAHGFSAARTKDIADQAGVKQPTLFRYFKSKKELFFAAVFEPLEQITRRLVDTDLVEAVEGPARSGMYLAGLERHLATTIDVTPLLGVGLFSDPELGRAFYVERFWPLIQRWVGTTDATLRGWPHRDVDPLTLVMTVWGMCYGVAVDAILSGEPVDVADEAKQIRATLTSGMT